MTATPYKFWVNADRTILVRMWTWSGLVEVCTRERPDDTWGPPVVLREEELHA